MSKPSLKPELERIRSILLSQGKTFGQVELWEYIKNKIFLGDYDYITYIQLIEPI